MRESISLDQAYTLLTFSRRAAVLTLRARDLQHLKDSVFAVTLMDSEHADFRDILWALGITHYAGARLHHDVDGLFREAAAFVEPEVGKLITSFITRDPEDKTLRAWGYAEVETANGIGLVRSAYDHYAPTRDLVRIGLDIIDVVEADGYGAADLEIATTLPTVWLKRAGERAVRVRCARHERGPR